MCGTSCWVCSPTLLFWISAFEILSSAWTELIWFSHNCYGLGHIRLWHVCTMLIIKHCCKVRSDNFRLYCHTQAQHGIELALNSLLSLLTSWIQHFVITKHKSFWNLKYFKDTFFFNTRFLAQFLYTFRLLKLKYFWPKFLWEMILPFFVYPCCLF